MSTSDSFSFCRLELLQRHFHYFAPILYSKVIKYYIYTLVYCMNVTMYTQWLLDLNYNETKSLIRIHWMNWSIIHMYILTLISHRHSHTHCTHVHMHTHVHTNRQAHKSMQHAHIHTRTNIHAYTTNTHLQSHVPKTVLYFC